jgi:HrpA-like RNA helicase
VVVTQPRRAAAVSIAARVAEERGEALGDGVGYAVRFDAAVTPVSGTSVWSSMLCAIL